MMKQTLSKHFLLFYDVGDNFIAQRARYRDRHLEYAWAASQRGELILAGALADPPNGAVLLFRGENADAATRFAEHDPYVTGGLVTSWRVREWTTVVGEQAATPVRPLG